MKTLLCVLCVLCGSILRASDLTLTDGRVFHDATITSQSATSVTVRHTGGLASIPKTSLPADLQAQYPLSAPSASSAVKPSDAERIAKARADEAARVARAKATREARAQWFKDNPQEHLITYRVVTHTPSTKLTAVTPEGTKTFVPVVDSYGTWEQTFTAKDGFELSLRCAETGTDYRTGGYASNITLSVFVDYAEVRQVVLEPRSGSLDIRWLLGAYDVDQPAVVRTGGTKESNVANNDDDSRTTRGTGSVKIIRKDPGFIYPDDWKP